MKSQTKHNRVARVSKLLIDAVEAAYTSPEEATDSLIAMMKHPRSLARPTAQWRPPTLRLPSTALTPQLTVTVSRHRVGRNVRESVHNFGEKRTPAYLITLRFSDPTGRPVGPKGAEMWVRSVVADSSEDMVHELTGQSTPTYCWIVDAYFRPMPSPRSLFTSVTSAA